MFGKYLPEILSLKTLRQFFSMEENPKFAKVKANFEINMLSQSTVSFRGILKKAIKNFNLNYLTFVFQIIYNIFCYN